MITCHRRPPCSFGLFSLCVVPVFLLQSTYHQMSLVYPKGWRYLTAEAFLAASRPAGHGKRRKQPAHPVVKHASRRCIRCFGKTNPSGVSSETVRIGFLGGLISFIRHAFILDSKSLAQVLLRQRLAFLSNKYQS